MVPGSTLMYGSSLMMETERPRLLSSRPTLAAGMPLPSEEGTPPVTKTYFAMGRVLRGFSNGTGSRPSGQPASEVHGPDPSSPTLTGTVRPGPHTSGPQMNAGAPRAAMEGGPARQAATSAWQRGSDPS